MVSPHNFAHNYGILGGGENQNWAKIRIKLILTLKSSKFKPHFNINFIYMFWVNSTPHMNPRCFWKWLFYPPNWQHLLSPFGKRAWQFYKKWSWLLSMSKLVAENVPPTHTDGSPITLCIINYLDSIILIKFLCSILMTVERDHRDNPHPVMEIF